MELTEVTKFRRAVLTGLARFTWQGTYQSIFMIYFIAL